MFNLKTHSIYAFYKKMILGIIWLFLFLFISQSLFAAEVIIVGNTSIKPIYSLCNKIKSCLPHQSIIVKTGIMKTELEHLIKAEQAKVVIALGKSGLDTCLTLSETTPVIYGLIAKPQAFSKKNITGIYMATPFAKYLDIIDKHFPNINKIGTLCLDKDNPFSECKSLSAENIIVHCVDDKKDILEAIKNLKNYNLDALILTPDKFIFSPKVLQAIYSFSFSQNVPIIGLAEKHVKVGSLFALNFDIDSLSKELCSLAEKVLEVNNVKGISQAAPKKYNLYINQGTAKRMNIPITPDFLNMSKKVY